MCNNDLYTCRDSSRINCTLACNTLGYIPCKNYMDRKVCSNILKKNKLYNSKSINDNNNPTANQNEINLLGSKFTINDSVLYLGEL